MGEVSGIIQDAPPAAEIINKMIARASELLGRNE
jgi:hypothetical protein